ncbi:MAG: efflux transporter outer membrane subunit [Betaproteobacteria bacterium]|jgi:NodT family efflux transporter outer membrane factor (OMF) lipoprotein|nr:efflux transporter outer membrane subunit [Betaproteobacteria bacterium]
MTTSAPPRPRRLAVPCAAALLLAGCAAPFPVGPDYQGPPGDAMPRSGWQVRGLLPATAAKDSTSAVPGTAVPPSGEVRAASAELLRTWWQQFDDPLLAGLIASAQDASGSLAQAALRIAQARTELTAAQARALPTLEGSLAATRSAVTFAGPVILRTLVQAQTQASWEIDLFGAIARSREGAVARLFAREAQWQDAQVALAAEVGNAYLGLRHCERQLELTEADAASRIETARLTAITGSAGLESPANVALARASAADAANRRVQQRTECDVLVKSLVVLTGRDEAALRQQLAASTARLPQPQHFRVDRMPAEVLRQRPDLAALERELAAASADISKAQAALYPSLSLAGNIGPLRSQSGGITVTASSWSIGPTLSIPLFDGGRRASSVDAARIAYRAAEAAYRERARVAVREVEEAMLRLAAADERERFALEAAAGYRQAFEAADARHRAGLGSLVELEDARRTAVQADTALAELRRDRLAAWVSLYRAVGGGWEAPAAPAVPATPAAPTTGATR